MLICAYTKFPIFLNWIHGPSGFFTHHLPYLFLAALLLFTGLKSLSIGLRIRKKVMTMDREARNRTELPRTSTPDNGRGSMDTSTIVAAAAAIESPLTDSIETAPTPGGIIPDGADGINPGIQMTQRTQEISQPGRMYRSRIGNIPTLLLVLIPFLSILIFFAGEKYGYMRRDMAAYSNLHTYHDIVLTAKYSDYETEMGQMDGSRGTPVWFCEPFTWSRGDRFRTLSAYYIPARRCFSFNGPRAELDPDPRTVTQVQFEY